MTSLESIRSFHKEEILGKKIPFSVAIITKNEEDNLLPCLQSISCAGQIVLVDSWSTDKTQEITAVFA